MSRVPTTGCSRASLQWLSTSVASSISSARPRAPRSNQCQAGQARLSTELAHRRLFERPLVEPNMYIIRMYDLSKWEEAAATRVPVAIDANSVIHVHGASTFQVPVKVDERLVLQSSGASCLRVRLQDWLLYARPGWSYLGHLLGCSESATNELWMPYLEKASCSRGLAGSQSTAHLIRVRPQACAKHCGGFSELNGGECIHGWALMTGCKFQCASQHREIALCGVQRLICPPPRTGMPSATTRTTACGSARAGLANVECRLPALWTASPHRLRLEQVGPDQKGLAG